MCADCFQNVFLLVIEKTKTFTFNEITYQFLQILFGALFRGPKEEIRALKTQANN
jgi:hypothetical protein